MTGAVTAVSAGVDETAAATGGGADVADGGGAAAVVAPVALVTDESAGAVAAAPVEWARPRSPSVANAMLATATAAIAPITTGDGPLRLGTPCFVSTGPLDTGMLVLMPTVEPGVYAPTGVPIGVARVSPCVAGVTAVAGAAILLLISRVANGRPGQRVAHR